MDSGIESHKNGIDTDEQASAFFPDGSSDEPDPYFGPHLFKQMILHEINVVSQLCLS